VNGRRLDYDGTLIMRVIVNNEIKVEDILTFDQPEEADAKSEAHARLTTSYLAEGHTVRLEALNLDGSLFGLTILEPRPGEPGYEIVHHQEYGTEAN
jgi:hypothetical protein